MADKKFLDAMKKKFTEDPTEKRTQFYNMGGWTQSAKKTAFVNCVDDLVDAYWCLKTTIEKENLNISL